MLKFSRVLRKKKREFIIFSSCRDGVDQGSLNSSKLKRAPMKGIESAKKQHNFVKALPAHLSEQADLAMKDEYVLGFLRIKKPILEVELERRMVNKIVVPKIKEVMLELGYGFSFIGNQYPIKANNTKYLIDLLFYNRRLKSLVVLEIKMDRFKSEYAEKMNFYLNLLDDFVREPRENSS